MAVIAAAIGVFFFYSGDFSEGPSSIADSQQSAVIVPFTKIVSGSQSQVSRRVNYVITSSAELNELWKMVDTTATPPNIDFEKDAVIAVFAGERPTTGYAIEVSNVVDSNTRLVSITLTKPDGNCMTGQSLTTPYEIVAVPTTSLPLSHEDISTTVSCQN